MEFLPSKKLSHADGLSKLIPKLCEPLDTIIAAVRAENEIKNSVILCDLRVTLDEIN